jgi:MbtH protein
MSAEDSEASRAYLVVVNDEGQYSIWPVDGPQLRGWHTVGAAKPRAECLADIETLWTDMRPVSLRAHMDGNGAN